ncbi:MAG: PCYCGC motif-containing (lipo)protein [Nanoarchaeota archaeon]|nr:PCYCGC motif-containing (lipo)protein [Nanoarchaeota archaeon]
MKKSLPPTKIIGIIVIAAFIIGVIYFFVSSAQATNEVPSYVTGEMREVYTWAKTTEGKTLLEQLPCYCGCKYEGHLHARHCYWRDDGTFDKHGVTCSVCFDIAKKAKMMQAEGEETCTIRQTIDTFYLPNKHLGTLTPMPEGCS